MNSCHEGVRDRNRAGIENADPAASIPGRSIDLLGRHQETRGVEDHSSQDHSLLVLPGRGWTSANNVEFCITSIRHTMLEKGAKAEYGDSVQFLMLRHL
eukprot:gene26144-biopygen14385